MSADLKPWAKGPFELILHAEIHYRRGDDYDRRLALISFDNSIEVSVTAYLSLNPIQRNGREYEKKDVDKWLRNYHSKLDFLGEEVKARGLTEEVGKDVIVWYHDHRNEQYHGGGRGVPEKETLDGIRKAAIWIFSALYNVTDVEGELDAAIREKGISVFRERNGAIDRLIDDKHGVVHVAGLKYYSSELLFAIDPDMYLDVGNDLNLSESDMQEDIGEGGEA